MKSIEYNIIIADLTDLASAGKLLNTLDARGKEGWDLVAVINTKTKVLHYIKRSKED
jgi:hypothetical protein